MKITIEFNDKDMMNYKKGIQDVLDIVSKISNAEKPKQQEIEQMLKSSGVTKQAEVKQQQSKTVEQTPQYDVVELQKAANEKSKKIQYGVKKVKDIIKKYGVEKLPDLKESDFASFMKDLEALE